MDKKRSLLNVMLSIIFKILLIVPTLLNRRYVISCLGDEINGLNSLFISLLGFLSVAEIGVASAITFCMYKPIVNGDNKKMSALYRLFEKLYIIIGLVILFSGCILIPFLPYLVADYSSIDVNVYFTFFLALVATVLSYFYGAKSSLIDAYKDNYIVTLINSSCSLLKEIIQIVILVCTKSFILYLTINIATNVLCWIVTEIVARKMHGDIIVLREKLDANTKKDVVKSIKAMFMHKIGDLVVTITDSIIISAFLGSVVLGRYSNYIVIATALVSVITLFFSPLTSVIGHMVLLENKQKSQEYFENFYNLNFALGVLFFFGYFSVIDDLVSICFGTGLEIAKLVSLFITINQFVNFMRRSVITFKDATGSFVYDKWKSLVAAILNVGLSILLVVILPNDYKLVGVIFASILTNLCVCHTVEPFVLFKHCFKSNPKRFILRNFLYIFIFSIFLVLLMFVDVENTNNWMSLLINGFISVGFSTALILSMALVDKKFRNGFSLLLNIKKRKEHVNDD